MQEPIPDLDGHWPSCDDEQPGVSIRPLSHADLAALLAHLHQHGHDHQLARILELALFSKNVQSDLAVGRQEGW